MNYTSNALNTDKYRPGEAALQEWKNNTSRDTIVQDYVCGGECRICPFPGAKCTPDPDLWNHVK